MGLDNDQHKTCSECKYGTGKGVKIICKFNPAPLKKSWGDWCGQGDSK